MIALTKRAHNIAGKRFGKLTALYPAYKGKKGEIYWLCICDCGNETPVQTRSLINYRTKSCGCLRTREYSETTTRLGLGDANFNALYRQYCTRAKRNNRDFEFSKEQFREITKLNCFYCGEPAGNTISMPGMYGCYSYNGIDRVDNTKGYTIENSVPCCWGCNSMKRGRSISEFLGRVERIYTTMKGRA